MSDDNKDDEKPGDDPPSMLVFVCNLKTGTTEEVASAKKRSRDDGPEDFDFTEKQLSSVVVEDKKRKMAKKRRWRNRPVLEPPFQVENLKDLLYIAWNYQGDAFDWFTLWSMIPCLTELDRMIGMKKLKQGILDLILYYLQGLHKRNGEIGEGDMLHTVLCAPPGCGKTTCAHILAKIYCRMGFLKTDKVVVAKRSDFVGKFIGHSESKTMKILESALGGVLFIDEAYSMGQSNDRTDSFAKASIDLINQFLSEHKNEFVCIIAGYEKELNECFFATNPGLRRRFPWTFHIEPYSGDDIDQMFHQRVKRDGWKLSPDAYQEGFFEQKKDMFPYFGGDIENLFTCCKTAHARRIFGFTEGKKTINSEDFKRGFDLYKKFKSSDKDPGEMSSSARMMYM